MALRHELAGPVSREFDWRRANGELRMYAVRDLLVRLAARGHVRLSFARTPQARRSQKCTPIGDVFLVPPAPVSAAAVVLADVVVRPMQHEETAPWHEAMARFHYLGNGRVVGEVMRYVVLSQSRWVDLLA